MKFLPSTTKFWIITIFINALIESLTCVIVNENSPVVKIEEGLVRGVWKKSVVGKPLQVFYGIPYAASPTGQLRYRPPVPVDKWDGVLDAVNIKPGCVQKKFPFGQNDPYLSKFLPNSRLIPVEDCLRLNVFVPKDLPENASVLVWIYGGGFSRGSADIPLFDGSTLSTEQQMIIVSINYRLASFGFLFLDHPEAPGNVGLMDQIIALKWVQRNIAAFGGNPNSVTIAGQSAGASSVGYHLILPESRNLFQRAIMQSGAPHASFAMEKRATMLSNAVELAGNLGCPNNLTDVESMVNCMRKKDAFDLLENEPQISYDHVYIFRPVVDGQFVYDHPLQMLKNTSNINEADILLGTVKDESTTFLSSFYPLNFQFRNGIKITEYDLNLVAEEFFGVSGVALDVAKAIYEKPHQSRTGFEAREIIIRITSDANFDCPVSDFEDFYATTNHSVYKYFFTYRPQDLSIPDWYGTHHGIELVYIFGDALDSSNQRPEFEVDFTKRVMSYWANFVKTGNPNGPDTKIYWPQLTVDNKEFLVLSPATTAVGNHLKARKCAFWKNIIPEIIKMQKPVVYGLADIMRSNI